MYTRTYYEMIYVCVANISVFSCNHNRTCRLIYLCIEENYI